MAPLEQELLTLPEHLSSTYVFNGVRVNQDLGFCAVFCELLFLVLSVFFRPLYFLSFNLRLLTTPSRQSDDNRQDAR